MDSTIVISFKYLVNHLHLAIVSWCYQKDHLHYLIGYSTSFQMDCLKDSIITAIIVDFIVIAIIRFNFL